MKTQRTRFKASAGESAFSLIEIMVAVTLLAVITVGLLSMFYHTQRAFRLGAGQVDTLEAGRTTMQLLSRELQEMYPSHINGVINFEAIPIGTARLDMDLPGGLYRTNLIQDISFISRRGNEWIGVSYRVAHDNRGAGTLYRSVISTNPSLQTAAMPASPPAVIAQLFRDITGPAVLSEDPKLHNPNFHRIADGVVHLRVRGAYDDRGRVYSESSQGFYSFTNSVPAYLDVELGILDPKAQAQFETRTTPEVARSWLAGQAHRVHLFTQRIPIRSHHGESDLFTFSGW